MTNAKSHATGEKERDVARVSVRILEKEYFVACPYEERSDLLDSAEFLNSKMREIRDSGKVVGLDRIAVMAALNLANELLKQHLRPPCRGTIRRADPLDAAASTAPFRRSALR